LWKARQFHDFDVKAKLREIIDGERIVLLRDEKGRLLRRSTMTRWPHTRAVGWGREPTGKMHRGTGARNLAVCAAEAV